LSIRDFVLPEVIGDFVAELLEFGSDQRGGFLFLGGELGIFVEMLVGAEPVLDIAVDLVVKLGLLSLSGPDEQEG
jgi:hypothetical protein